MINKYHEFLKRKIAVAKNYGFNIDIPLIKFKDGTILKPHQRDGIVWAIKGGRRALFESWGLGKTVQQLIICNEILKFKKGKGLIVCPLGVMQEFKNDATNKLGIKLTYVKNQAEAKKCKTLMITNYERVRDGDIDPKYFTVISLDEASVLRGFGTKTYQTFLPKFKGVKYKFVATATPSPNKYKELIHYAGYLEIMDTGQALTRFFKRDSTKANNLTLYPHKEDEFWLWISTWALFITKPSDLGYENEGYDLPDIEFRFHELPVDHSTAGIDKEKQYKLYREAALSLPDAAKEKNDSIDNRVNKMVEIINESPIDHFVIWHHLEAERKAINKTLPECVDVYGSQDYEKREARIMDFSNGKEKYLSTKPSIAGSGCNFQKHCHRAIFLGINYEFNDFIQAIHRIYRFLQTEKVIIDIIHTESEREILKVLLRKMEQHYKLVDNMVKIIKEHGLNIENTKEKLIRTMFKDRKEIKSTHFTAVNNDAVEEWPKLKDNSIGLFLTSIPFANHYEYTPTYNDMGHTVDNSEFWEQMDFLTPEILRTLMPGRIAAIHVKDRILFSSMTEFSFPTVSPFHAEAIHHYMNHGFGFLGMITIETDVVRENNQTYRLGWTERCKDASKIGVGSPEYVLLFRKQPTSYENAYSDIPVFKDKKLYTRGQWQIDARAKWNSSGDRFLTPDEIRLLDLKAINKLFTNYFESNIYDYEKHVKTAKDLDKIEKLPATFETLRLKSRNWYLWDDINRMLTLNGEQNRKNLMMHVCPLQFDIVDRLINNLSNPGEIVADSFGGLMTVPYRAIKLGRKAFATELNPEYWRDGISYCRAAENEVNMPTLFDAL